MESQGTAPTPAQTQVHAQAHAKSQTKSDDRKGGAGHNVVVAVLLAFPIVKVAWTVGGGEGDCSSTSGGARPRRWSSCREIGRAHV